MQANHICAYSRNGHGKGSVLQNASVGAAKGLKQIAITDHGCVQSFTEALHVVEGWLRCLGYLVILGCLAVFRIPAVFRQSPRRFVRRAALFFCTAPALFFIFVLFVGFVFQFQLDPYHSAFFFGHGTPALLGA